MYEMIKAVKGNTVGLKLRSRLTKQDYQEITTLLEQKIGEHGQINVLIQLEEFDGLELGAVWEDLKFDVRHHRDFGRVAIVGKREWIKWMTKLSDIFFAAEAEFYQPEQLEQAWQWVRAQSPSAQPVN